MPDGRVVKTDVNRRGEVERIEGYVDAIEHDARARLVGYRAANGAVSSFTFDDDDRLNSMRTAVGNATVLSLQFSRDVRGRLTEIDDAVGTGRFSLSKQMTYDGHGRLSHVQYGTGTDAEVVQFAYDALHRTTSRTSSLGAASADHLGEMTYTAEAPQALSATAHARYDYDARGRLLTRTANTNVNSDDVSDADSDLELSWDGLSRLRRAERADGTSTTWAWAGHHMRLYRHSAAAETWWFGNEFQIVDGVARLLVKVGNDVVVEEDSTALTARFIGDEDDDGVITAADAAAKAGDAQRRALRAAARTLLVGDSGVARRYPVSDHLGSVVAVVDDAGAVVERFATTVTGALRASSAVHTEAARVVGGELDATGLVDLGARFYAPHEGRFISPDPTFSFLDDETLKKMPDSLGAYSYAGNGPVSSIDFDGRFPWKKIGIGLAVTAAAGAIVAGCVTGVLPALVVGTVAAMAAAVTVTAIVGAVIGGVAGCGAALLEARETLKTSAALNESGRPSAGDYATAALSVAMGTVVGVVGGFFTGGISAVFDVARAGVTYAEHRGKIGTRTATVARFIIGVGAVLAFANFRAFGTAAVKLVLDLLVPAYYGATEYQDASKRKSGIIRRDTMRKQKRIEKARSKTVKAVANPKIAHEMTMQNLKRSGVL